MAPVVGIIGAVASAASAFAPLLMKPKTPSGGSSNTSSLESELYARRSGEESDAARTATRDAARKRQLALAASGVGRNDTILTGPFGEVGGSAGQPKTLLGT